MTVAVGAGNNCWRYYGGGILSSADGCPTGIDHAVTLVAYTATGGSSGETTFDCTNAERTLRKATSFERRTLDACEEGWMYASDLGRNTNGYIKKCYQCP